jgi:biopolymer transport protein ExbD
MLEFKSIKNQYQIQAPLTSLIDIVFLLLIYFMLTTNFVAEEGIQVKLPNARASAPQLKQEITIFIDKEGATYMSNTQIPIDMLYTRIQQLLGNDTDRLIVVKADRTVMLNKAVRVMDIAKAAGAARLCLATEKGY